MSFRFLIFIFLILVFLIFKSFINPSNKSSQFEKDKLKSPIINIKYKYYNIKGETLYDLSKEMSEKGPVWKEQKATGLTEWNVIWTAKYKTEKSECKVDFFVVTVDVVYTLPKIASSQSPVGWARYINALEKHEEGHKDNGVNAGLDIYNMIKNMKAISSCEDLTKAINLNYDKIIKEYNQKDLDFDKITNHGENQGVNFN